MVLWKKSIVFLIVSVFILSAAASDKASGNPAADQSGQSSEPVLTDRSIRIGEKTLTLEPNGTLVCLNAQNEQIFKATVTFWAVEDGKPKWDWQTRYLDRKKSRFFRNGKKYFWELWYESPEVAAFQGITQQLEVLPDGRIMFFAKLDLPYKRARRVFQDISMGFYLPDKLWKGETAEINGENFELNDEINQAKRAPVTFVFGRNNPSRRFSLTLEGSDKIISRLWLYYWQIRQNFHVRTSVVKGRLDRNTARFYLDLRNVPPQSAKQDPRGAAGSPSVKKEK